MSSPPPPESSSRQAGLDQAFNEAVQAISKDMTMILHGSGDGSTSASSSSSSSAVSDAVNPETVHLLSSLTVQYMGRLVDAALDSYSMFLNDPATMPVPPPSFVSSQKERETRRRTPALPEPFERPNKKPKVIYQPLGATATATSASAASSSNKEEFSKRKQPKRHLREEYWDEGLPEPKIRSKEAAAAAPTTASRKSNKKKNDIASEDKITTALVPMDEWVGAMGVDFYEGSIRKAHVMAGGGAIGPSHFCFPICHDVYAYGRVRDVQAAKRKLDPILQDFTVNEMVREEGKRRHHHHHRQPSTSTNNKKTASAPEDDPEDDDDDEDDDDNAEEDLPAWPDMDFLLPIHRSID